MTRKYWISLTNTNTHTHTHIQGHTNRNVSYKRKLLVSIFLPQLRLDNDTVAISSEAHSAPYLFSTQNNLNHLLSPNMGWELRHVSQTAVSGFRSVHQLQTVTYRNKKNIYIYLPGYHFYPPVKWSSPRLKSTNAPVCGCLSQDQLKHRHWRVDSHLNL